MTRKYIAPVTLTALLAVVLLSFSQSHAAKAPPAPQWQYGILTRYDRDGDITLSTDGKEHNREEFLKLMGKTPADLTSEERPLQFMADQGWELVTFSRVEGDVVRRTIYVVRRLVP